MMVETSMPPGTISDTTTKIVTGFKVTKNFFFNDIHVPNWIREKLPPDRPWWERMGSTRLDTNRTHRHIFGKNKKPIENVHLAGLYRTLAVEGFVPESVSCKYVSAKHVAISILWTRNRYKDSESKMDLCDDVSNFLQQVTGLFSWSIYAKELTDDRGATEIILNIGSPRQQSPWWRFYEFCISDDKLVGIRRKPKPAL